MTVQPVSIDATSPSRNPRPLLRRFLSSDLGRMIRASPGCLPFQFAHYSGKPLEIDVRLPMGMGAILAHAVRLWAWAEDKGVALQVRATTPLYSNGEDCIATYFENCAEAGEYRPLSPKAGEWMMRQVMPRHISLDRASEICARCLRPNDRLLTEVDRISGSRPFDLAIHFRGTDKFAESGSVHYDSLTNAGGPYFASARRVFLATDAAGFASYVRAKYPHIEFISFDLGVVQDGKPRHFSDLPAEEKALEALVNIFMIAKAPVCIRTSSYMSSLSRLINPEQRTVTINKTLTKNTPFPEREILEFEQSWDQRSPGVKR